MFSSAKVQQSHPLLSSLLSPGESWGFWTCCCVERKVFLEGGREGGTDAERNGFFWNCVEKGEGRCSSRIVGCGASRSFYRSFFSFLSQNLSFTVLTPPQCMYVHAAVTVPCCAHLLCRVPKSHELPHPFGVVGDGLPHNGGGGQLESGIRRRLHVLVIFLALFPSVGDFLSTCCFNIWRFSCAAPLLCPPPLNVLHFSPLFTPRKKLTRRRGGKWEKSGEKKDSPQKNGLKNFFSLSDLIKGWMDSQFCVGRCLWGSRRRSPPSLLFWK